MWVNWRKGLRQMPQLACLCECLDGTRELASCARYQSLRDMGALCGRNQ